MKIQVSLSITPEELEALRLLTERFSKERAGIRISRAQMLRVIFVAGMKALTEEVTLSP